MSTEIAGARDYRLPTAESLTSPFVRYAFFCIPGCAVLGAIAGAPAGLEKALEAGLSGFFVGIPFTVIFGIVGAIVTSRRLRANWSKHNYQWYRETFPGNVQGNRVTCRHCGSSNVRTSNLMNQTYMRLHACGQCCETLYFTPEGR